MKAIDIKSKKIIIDLDKKHLRPTEVDFLKGDFSKARKKQMETLNFYK